MRYAVTITETSKMAVTVEADNQFEAEKIVSDRWKNSEYVLDYSNFCTVNFRARELKKEVSHEE